MENVKFIFGKNFMEQWFACGLGLDERQELIDNVLLYLTNAPDNNYGKKFPGAIIEGTGGAIKYRFTPENYQKGKSGSFRVIYFVYNPQEYHLFFLNVYPKNKKATLSTKEKNQIKKFINHFKEGK